LCFLQLLKQLCFHAFQVARLSLVLADLLLQLLALVLDVASSSLQLLFVELLSFIVPVNLIVLYFLLALKGFLLVQSFLLLHLLPRQF
jgi:hypothetical protein